MKRKIWIGFLMILCFMLWGCSLSKTKQDETETEKADYIIGVEGQNAPYYVADEKGNASRLYVDLMEKLGEKGGYSFAFTEVDSSAFQATAGENGCDVFLGVLEKETSDMTELFQTSSFYQSGVCLVARSEDGIKKCKELRNTAIDARTASGEADFAEYLAMKYEADAVVFADGKTAWDDFIQGNTKAVVIDENNCQEFMNDNPSVNVIKTSEQYHNFHRFTAVGQTEFLAVLESGIAELQSDGTLDDFLQNYGLK